MSGRDWLILLVLVFVVNVPPPPFWRWWWPKVRGHPREWIGLPRKKRRRASR